MADTDISRLRGFVRRFWSHDPAGVSEAAVLTFVLAAVQGVGILTLVPLVTQIGIPDGDGGGPLGAIASVFFDGIGLPRSLTAILALYLGLVAARAWLERRRTVHDAALRLSFVRGLRREMYDALVRADGRSLPAARSSDFLQVLTHDLERVGHAAYRLLNGCVSAAMLLVYLALALALSVPATVLTFGVAGALTFLLRERTASARASGRKLTHGANRMYSVAAQHLAGLREVKSYSAEERSARAFGDAVAGIDQARLDFFEDRAGARFWMTTGGAVALAGILLFAVEGLGMLPASLVVLMYVLARGLPLVGQLHQSGLEFVNAMPAFEEMERWLGHLRKEAAPEQGGPAPALTREIVLDQVGFAYGPERPALRDVSVAIPARRTTAVLGHSGAGKSTLGMLLMAFSPPDHGRIVVDGTPLEPTSQRRWREGIGYVPQEPFLFHDTVRENLLWARPDATDDELWDSLETAAAADFVRRAPGALDAVVGDRGTRLSGGERQRIALARALLVRPHLLLLDEATNALDLESEERIFDALNALHGRLTIVLITHRIPDSARIDQIVELDRGTVAAVDRRRETDVHVP